MRVAAGAGDRLQVTLPGCWVRVGRLAYGYGCYALFILLLTIYPDVRNSRIFTVRRAWRSEHGSAYRLRSGDDWRNSSELNDLTIICDSYIFATKDFDLRNTACAQSAHSDMRCPSLNGCLHCVASNNWLPDTTIATR